MTGPDVFSRKIGVAGTIGGLLGAIAGAIYIRGGPGDPYARSRFSGFVALGASAAEFAHVVASRLWWHWRQYRWEHRNVTVSDRPAPWERLSRHQR